MPDYVQLLEVILVFRAACLLLRTVNLYGYMVRGSVNSKSLGAAFSAYPFNLSVGVLVPGYQLSAVWTVPLKYLPIIIRCHPASLLAYLPVLPGEPP